MSQIVNKPHLIFIFTIPLVLLFGIFFGDSALDINVHDTYFVISYMFFAILISILLGVIGVGYWIMQKTNKRLSKQLIWVHIVLTYGGTLIISILSQLYRTELMEYKFNNNITLIMTLIVLLMLVGQLIFPINIVYGLLKKNNQTVG